jgi:photosystem II stability/assembly factor-like uncharacterized protein
MTARAWHARSDGRLRRNPGSEEEVIDEAGLGDPATTADSPYLRRTFRMLKRIWGITTALALVTAVSATAGRAAEKHSFEHVHALAMDAEGRTLFVGAHTGLFRSEDGGRSWKPVGLPGNPSHFDVMAVAVDPKDSTTIYVGTHEAGVLKSTDGGQTWRATNAGLGGPDVHGLAVDPNAPRTLHAAVREKGEGIYRTTDGGDKWVRVDDGPGGEVKVLTSVNIPTGMGGIFLYAGTAEGLQRNPDCF